MGVMNVFAGIHSSAEEHGNEHNLPGPEVRHVYSFKERAQIIILQNFAIEEFRSSLDSATSTDQFKEVFSHCVLINNESNRDIFSWKAITLKTPPAGGQLVKWRFFANNPGQDIPPPLQSRPLVALRALSSLYQGMSNGLLPE